MIGPGNSADFGGCRRETQILILYPEAYRWQFRNMKYFFQPQIPQYRWEKKDRRSERGIVTGLVFFLLCSLSANFRPDKNCDYVIPGEN